MVLLPVHRIVDVAEKRVEETLLVLGICERNAVDLGPVANRSAVAGSECELALDRNGDEAERLHAPDSDVERNRISAAERDEQHGKHPRDEK